MISFLCGVLFTSTSACANQQLSPIIVKANPLEKGRPQKSNTGTETTVSRTAMDQNQYRSLNETLNSSPGVYVVQSGPLGQQSSIFIRGANAGQVQVRQDGMRVNGPEVADGTFSFGVTQTDGLGSVNIIRGPQGCLYGPDAIGGIILMETPQGKGDFVESLMVEVGSYKTGRARGSLAGEKNKLDAFVELGRDVTGGFVRTPKEFRVSGGLYPNLRFHQSNISSRLGVAANDNTHISFINRLSDSNLTYEAMNHGVPQFRQQSIHRLIVDTKTTENWVHQLGVGFLNNTQKDDPHGPGFAKSHGTRIQIDWSQSYTPFQGDQVLLNLEGFGDTMNLQRTNLTKAHQNTGGVGLFNKFERWGLTFEAGGRVDRVSDCRTHGTYRFGLGYEAPTKTKIFSSVGTSFKAPTLYQLYFTNQYYTGNPLLKPEQSKGFESGIRQEFGKVVSFQAVYFINHINHLIDYNFLTRSPVNIGKARTSGVETGLKWRVLPWLGLEANHTYTEAWNLLTSQRLLRRPLNKWFGRLTLTQGAWMIITELTRVGARQDVHPTNYNRQRAKGYMIAGLKSSWKWDDSLKLFGRIENCFDKKVQDPLGYRKAGFSLFAGMEIKIG